MQDLNNSYKSLTHKDIPPPKREHIIINKSITKTQQIITTKHY